MELKSDRVLGRGALSYVFRGRVGLLRTAVAIKRLEKEGKETPKAFCRELMIASSLQHPNIVPLLGFCIDPEEGLFLVYKYVSSGSLERHLHGIASALLCSFMTFFISFWWCLCWMKFNTGDIIYREEEGCKGFRIAFMVCKV